MVCHIIRGINISGDPPLGLEFLHDFQEVVIHLLLVSEPDLDLHETECQRTGNMWQSGFIHLRGDRDSSPRSRQPRQLARGGIESTVFRVKSEGRAAHACVS